MSQSDDSLARIKVIVSLDVCVSPGVPGGVVGVILGSYFGQVVKGVCANDEHVAWLGSTQVMISL